MSEELQPVIERLDILIKLTATSLLGEKSQKEQIGLLSGSGLAPKEIAELLNTTPNTVSVVLASIRKAHKRKTKTRTN